MERSKQKPGILMRILLLIMGVLFIFVIALLLIRGCTPKKGLDFETAQVEGLLDTGRSAEEIQSALNDVVEEGRFAVSINPAMNLRDGRLDVRIENKPTNRYYMQVSIVLSGGEHDGQEIYSSGVIRQGYSVETGKALFDLPVGFYDAVAVVNAIDPETEETVGATNAVVVIGVPWGDQGLQQAEQTSMPEATSAAIPEATPELLELPDGSEAENGATTPVPEEWSAS